MGISGGKLEDKDSRAGVSSWLQEEIGIDVTQYSLFWNGRAMIFPIDITLSFFLSHAVGINPMAKEGQKI